MSVVINSLKDIDTNEMLYRSRAMTEIVRSIGKIARTSFPVLILGESGVGKELIARELHRASGRGGTLVTENVGAIGDHLIGDALFGHVQGAYTGAGIRRKGLLECTANGTLFLDEIGTASSSTQALLLRVVESGRYLPLGSDMPSMCTSRFVFASGDDLLGKVKNGGFRQDLYYRIAAYQIVVPPLRERVEDISLLAEKFVKEVSYQLGFDPPPLSAGAIESLRSRPLLGNARELRSLILGALIRNNGSVIRACDLQESAQIGDVPASGIAFGGDLPTVRELRRELIVEAMRRAGGSQTVAARMIGLTPSAINKNLKPTRS